MKRRAFIRSVAATSAMTLSGCASGYLLRHRNELLAGASRRKVTPPLWVPYLKSSSAGLNTPFTGHHDDLFARALALDDGEQSMAILSVDAIGYDNTVLGSKRNFTDELRQRVAQRTRLRPESIMLCATHAHSTPETIGLSPFLEVPGVADWLENHLSELVEAIVEAWQNRVPVEVRHGTSAVTGIARNRRIMLKNGTMNRYGPLPSISEIAKPGLTDEQLSVVYLQTRDGQPHSVLLNYTAHPVITMLLPNVSADFPGAASTQIEKQLKGAVCLFTNGAAGNINTFQVTTNYHDATLVGQKLADAALAKIGSLRKSAPFQTPQLNVHSETRTLSSRTALTLEEAETQFGKNPNAANGTMLRLARKLAEGPIFAEIQAMQLGPLRWIALPGEPFVETGLALKQKGANFVIGYANGWIGYLPTQDAYPDGGYECDPGAWSRVAPGSGETLEEAASKMLRRFAV